METIRKKIFSITVLTILAVGGSSAGAADDTFYATFDSSGSAQGGGSGYNGGQWYYYPGSGYYTQWFDNRPFTWNASKEIEWSLTVAPQGGAYADAAIEIAINWTTEQWQQEGRPPLPSIFSNGAQSEDAVIKRVVAVPYTDLTYTRTFKGTVTLEGYCPAYVSIDIQAVNVRITNGTIKHTCYANEPQAYYDYGDAPDPTYPTLAASNGASHVIDDQVYLGARVDAEVDGQPNATATGDDNNNLDDEDGVVFASSLIPGQTADVEVTASSSGILSAWLDFNGNGAWSDVGDQIFINQPLSAGLNTLSFAVPTQAVTGYTFARFRFSSSAGLSYRGQAPNGEVEDYRVQIEPPYQDQAYHFKWEQPPLEFDPWASDPVYCGWDEPSYVVLQGNYPNSYTPRTNWNFVADNFRCFGSMPIASIHWWGSYLNWTQANYPPIRPSTWIIGFWSNAPGNASTPFNHPGQLLQAIQVRADQVDEVWAGRDQFPGKPADTCYKYSAYLRPDQYFWQEDYVNKTTDRVFWLSITAVYVGTQQPNYAWGWKTRPAHWRDDAVVFTTRSTSIAPGWEPPGEGVKAVENSSVCDAESYDVAFALDTDPTYVKWDQSFTGLRDWAHYEDRVSMASGAAASGIALKWSQPPDLETSGVDVDATNDLPQTWPPLILADDFECTASGPITGINVWGSWFSDILPAGDANNVRFTLSIHQDIPASADGSGYSRPGQVLWSKTYAPGTFTVQKQNGNLQSYYGPYTQWYLPSTHRDVYRYGFSIDQSQAFSQTGSTQQPVVYWLSVQAYLEHQPGTSPTRWGWKTSTQAWNDVAVYAQAVSPNGANWKPLGYPAAHAYKDRETALAFEITTSDYSTSLSVQNQVADDWLCDSAYPITAATWWGSYLGYNYATCACQDQTAPRKPDYFWLSIWKDIPDDYPNDPGTYSRPGQLVWQYRAYDYDEVLVGFDKHPENLSQTDSHEAVYRYSVRIPREYWFYQPGQKQVYWFSVVAVYSDASTVPYRWGWTNHAHVYNDNAVTTLFPHGYPFADTIFWTPLYDQTGANEDMSFMLFTDPNEYGGITY